MLQTIFHEFISSRIVMMFASWLIKVGYKSEGKAILTALISWANKQTKSLKQRYYE